MKKYLLFILLSLGLVYAKSSPTNNIHIAVSANAKYVIEELKQAFKRANPNIKVHVTVASSGKLAAQIEKGVPYGIFMSADMNYPKRLYNKKIAITKPAMYTQGALAFFSAKRRDFSEPEKLLTMSKIKSIAMPDPEKAPYGRVARQALQNSRIYSAIERKILFADNVAQTVTYMLTIADVGIVPTSSLYVPEMLQYKRNKNWVPVPLSLYNPIRQGIVLLKHAGKNKSYRKFYNFILSTKANKIFREYGYLVP